MISMVGGFFSTLGLFFSYLGDILIALFKFLLFMPMYLIYSGVMMVAQFAETTFKKLAGIDEIFLNGESFGGASDGTGQDLVYAFITDNAVQDVFWSIVALSVVLLFIFTLIALIRSEFTIDLKGSAKGPIFSRAFKSLINFFLVPTITIISIFATNFLTKTVYDLFTPEGTNIVTKCFQIGAYNANRARIDNKFVSDFLSGGLDEAFEANVKLEGGNANDLAFAIDKAFMDYRDASFTFKDKSMMEILEDVDDDKVGNWAINMIFFGTPKNVKTYSLYSLSQVNLFYDLSKFDYILAVGSGIVITWTLLSVCLVLVKRVFELTILFLLAPPMIAIAPLDGGQAEKKWRGEFMKRLLATIAPIFAYNVYFLMVPLFSNISLFNNNIMAIATETAATGGTMLGSLLVAIASFLVIFDIFFQLICIIVGLGILKSASALLSTLLGVDDLVKSGGEAAKKAVDVGKKAALGATAIGGVAFKGAAAAVKMGAGAVKGVASLATKGGRANAKAKLQSVGSKFKLGKANKELSKAEEEKEKAETAFADSKEGKEKMDNLKKLQDEKAAVEAQGGTFEKQDDLNAAIKDLDKAKSEDAGISAATNKLKAAQEKQSEAEKVHNTRKRGISAAAEKRLAAWKNGDQYLGEGSDKEEPLVHKHGKKKGQEFTPSELKKRAERMEKQAAKGGFFKQIADGYRSEFGENADKTGFLSKVTTGSNAVYSKIFGNVPILNKIPELTKSLNEQFAIDGSTAKRRLNDGLAGMFGDGGGGDLWKIWFNKNARAALYEGVPESKSRSGKIDASISWGSKGKYEAEEAEKNEKKKNMDLMKRFMANQMGLGNQYEQIFKAMEQAKAENDQMKVKKLQVEMADFEMKTGVKTAAEKKYASEGMNGADLKRFKDQLDAKADAEAAATTKKNAEEAAKLMAQQGVKTQPSDQPQKVKYDEKTLKDLENAIKNAFKEGSASMSEAINNAFDPAALKNAGGDGSWLQQIIDAINNLKG
ncbi:MAG: hypothetical protein IJB10_05540 [Clostridia bacterium]|nr:hypothetical protein [Clostridia bacterium]